MKVTLRSPLFTTPCKTILDDLMADSPYGSKFYILFNSHSPFSEEELMEQVRCSYGKENQDIYHAEPEELRHDFSQAIKEPLEVKRISEGILTDLLHDEGKLYDLNIPVSVMHWLNEWLERTQNLREYLK